MSILSISSREKNAYFTARYRLLSFPIWGRPAIFPLPGSNVQFVSGSVEDLLDLLLVGALGHQTTVALAVGRSVGPARRTRGPASTVHPVGLQGIRRGSAFHSVIFNPISLYEMKEIDKTDRIDTMDNLEN